ncbi:DUF1292 domain-containing protein|uniref:Uncharacterized protein n=1 Tax=Dendrosporobacter quercicolus TaxID=146817 RepID=A0A1G9KUC9_9FIRM|nr:DUF1292 domain-containing protein [Dendrosporobacter quercicolus]NSL46502.1 DUF1292 domain-containing protein [Dendrosporobacter quercicolus DSM 1736]SDL53164.1 Protein of unknown function [Dendrosporobacter quercicolus]
MADNEKDNIEELDEDLVVVMTDEEGNEYYYREELIIPIGEKRYAILVSIDDADCDCGCEASHEEDVYIARIDVDESGEEVYVDPTDEEFEQVREAYEELIEEEDEAE